LAPNDRHEAQSRPQPSGSERPLPRSTEGSSCSLHGSRADHHSRVTAWDSFGGQPSPWLPIKVLRRQMVNLHSFAVTEPLWAANLAYLDGGAVVLKNASRR